MTGWVWIAVLQVWGCGMGGGDDAAATKAKWTPQVDASTSTGVVGLANAALAAQPACHEALAGAAAGTALTASAFHAACDPLAGLYDARAKELTGTARQGDELLRTLAAFGDEADFLVAVLDDAERASMVDSSIGHLDDTLSKVAERAEKARSEPLRGYELRFGGDDKDAWERALHSDENGIGAVHDFLSRLALDQGIDPVLVRDRTIDARAALARTQLDARRTALEGATLPDAERQARAAYLDTSAATLTTFEAILARYARGEVTDEAAREPLIAEARQAQDAWRAAWQTEQARLGVAADDAGAAPGTAPEPEAAPAPPDAPVAPSDEAPAAEAPPTP
ncbi:MAG: hypothetical protein H6733_14700 [Alphaproteobacteria bacterium]|nr:hypothetical protein [Alphaproteobacteria bacterium]